jgi:hypothetical protein
MERLNRHGLTSRNNAAGLKPIKSLGKRKKALVTTRREDEILRVMKRNVGIVKRVGNSKDKEPLPTEWLFLFAVRAEV